MLQIHPNARTTPAVRAEIARSGEPSGVLAKRYGVSTETVRKWRKRGPGDCDGDRSGERGRRDRLPGRQARRVRAEIAAVLRYAVRSDGPGSDSETQRVAGECRRAERGR